MDNRGQTYASSSRTSPNRTSDRPVFISQNSYDHTQVSTAGPPQPSYPAQSQPWSSSYHPSHAQPLQRRSSSYDTYQQSIGSSEPAYVLGPRPISHQDHGYGGSRSTHTGTTGLQYWDSAQTYSSEPSQAQPAPVDPSSSYYIPPAHVHAHVPQSFTSFDNPTAYPDSQNPYALSQISSTSSSSGSSGSPRAESDRSYPASVQYPQQRPHHPTYSHSQRVDQPRDVVYPISRPSEYVPVESTNMYPAHTVTPLGEWRGQGTDSMYPVPGSVEPMSYAHGADSVSFGRSVDHGHHFPPPAPQSPPSISATPFRGSSPVRVKTEDSMSARSESRDARRWSGEAGPELQSTATGQPQKPKRRRADAGQLRVLNEVYARTSFPSTEERIELGKQLGMSPRQVQIWFQNRRQNAKAGRNQTPSSPSDSTVPPYPYRGEDSLEPDDSPYYMSPSSSSSRTVTSFKREYD